MPEVSRSNIGVPSLASLSISSSLKKCKKCRKKKGGGAVGLQGLCQPRCPEIRQKARSPDIPIGGMTPVPWLPCSALCPHRTLAHPCQFLPTWRPVFTMDGNNYPAVPKGSLHTSRGFLWWGLRQSLDICPPAELGSLGWGGQAGWSEGCGQGMVSFPSGRTQTLQSFLPLLLLSTALSFLPALGLPVQTGRVYCTAGDSVGRSESGASGCCPT